MDVAVNLVLPILAWTALYLYLRGVSASRWSYVSAYYVVMVVLAVLSVAANAGTWELWKIAMPLAASSVTSLFRPSATKMYLGAMNLLLGVLLSMLL